MSLAVADQIYKEKYATACDFDALNSGCDCVLFDFAVNSGISRAIKYAQIITECSVDGEMGPQTLKAINDCKPENFVNTLCNRRLSFLKSLRIWGTFGKGWNNRVRDLRQYSLRLVEQAKKPQGLMETPKKETFEAKSMLIKGAWNKGYHPEDVKQLRELHGTE